MTLSAMQPITRHEQFETARNVLPPRASSTTNAGSLSLNGTWRFRLSPDSSSEMDLLDPTLDVSWSSIDVPSHWQLRGWGAPVYLNQRYPFPLDPPFVPDENPTGDYVREFVIPQDWTGGRIVLRFEGVDSFARVWVNAVEMGSTSGSRLPNEFDITDDVHRDRTNTIAVRVNQGSSNSYIEDQDMWWLSGIFRDVTLHHRPVGSVPDHRVTADFDPQTGAGLVRVDTSVPARLVITELGIDTPAGQSVPISAVQPWSAESPRLYHGELIADGETLSLSIGFRRIEISDGVLLVNGARIVFRGVNRHEFHPEQGRAIDEATMLADVRLMKQFNINAVRTSHYPPHPRFLELCDEYGLWVIDECDFETHGFDAEGDDPGVGNPVDDQRWTAALRHRMLRMVVRDRNHPSIVAWSLGNECGPGLNIEAMATTARELDNRPVMYERDFTSAHADIYSRMYLPHDEVEQIGKREESALEDAGQDAHRRAQPFLLAEYAHAMGNGPGGLAEYHELFEQYPRLQGGFVWEWIDHGLTSQDDEGREYYAYGGDFGEVLHDSNFVADGLLFPDRTPSPGLLELKKVLEPIRFRAVAGGIEVTNAQDIADVTAFEVSWAFEEEGVIRSAGILPVPSIPSHQSVMVTAPQPPVTFGETFLTLRATLKEPTSWADAGHEVATGQWAVTTPTPSAPSSPKHISEPAVGPARFDQRGRLTQLGSIPISAARLGLWRAPIDNDYGYYGEPIEPTWRAVGLDRMQHRTVSVDWQDDRLIVVTRSAAAASRLAVHTRWEWTTDGTSVDLSLTATPLGEWTIPLPRLGVDLAVPRDLDNVSWFGRGPGESYIDASSSQLIGSYDVTVDDLQTPYLMPQENGNRSEVRRLSVHGPAGTLHVEGLNATFDFSARPWTAQQLDAARHPHDLVTGPEVWLGIDAMQHGLGSASCGPGVHPRHLHAPGPISMSLRFTVHN